MRKAVFKDSSIVSQLALMLIIFLFLSGLISFVFALLGLTGIKISPLATASTYSIVVIGIGALCYARQCADRPTLFLGLRPYTATWAQIGLLALSYLGCLLAVSLSAKGVEALVPYVPTGLRRMIESSGEMYARQIADMAREGKLLVLIGMAVIPGITEELFFRGAVLRWMRRVTNNRHHAAIWLTGIVFSLVHFDLAGLIPRIFLGAYLGYAYHHTRSIYVPMTLHILNNAFALWSLFLSK